MKKALVAVVAMTLAILCSAPASADANEDRHFYEVLQQRGFDLSRYTPSDVGTFGRSICDNARDGMSYTDLTRIIEKTGGFNDFETAMLIGNATTIYCPEYAPK